MTSNQGVQVLVVGAGPTGLFLAVALTQLGVRVRIVDCLEGPSPTSRALVMHARNMEFYRQFAIADDVLRRSLVLDGASLWVKGRRVGLVRFGEMGKGMSAFPAAYIYPQDEHERMLIAQLEQLGVRVERETELTDVRTGADAASVVLRHAGREERLDVPFVAGCDGTHSRVRDALGIGFPGGTYEHVFYVADVTASGPVLDRELHVALDYADFLAVFPLRDEGRVRLVGSIRDQSAARRGALTWDDVSSRAVDRMRVRVGQVHWFSTYHVHHRVADRFREGRAFLLGDAAHIHSPVGGQGMNTGLGDAANLAWKLAAVLHGAIDPRVLDSYEPERIAFARRLVRTTDRAFTFVTRNGPLARLVRLRVVPIVLPLAFRFRAMRRYMFRTVSQLGIEYRNGPMSRGAAGRVHGGDRLPWVAPKAAGAPDNHALLGSCDWQVHVYGQANDALRASCRAHDVPLHELPWSAAAARAGLARDAAYLVRPDGYVALAVAAHERGALDRYLEEWRIRASAPLATSAES